MANTKELEQKLEKQQAGYLSRLEGAGQLPSIISSEWQKAGGAETAKLRGEEAGLLTDYVKSATSAREKYKNIEDPYQRESFVSQSMSNQYKPIADIRSELAMRAEALGVATSSATAMYGAETQRAATGLGFTESAYSRALQKEQEATRQTERAEDIAREISEAAKNRAAARANKTPTQADITAATLSSIGDYAGQLKNKLTGMEGTELDQWAKQFSNGAYGGQNSRDVVYDLLLGEYGPQYQEDIMKIVYGVGGDARHDSTGGLFSGNWWNR